MALNFGFGGKKGKTKVSGESETEKFETGQKQVDVSGSEQQSESQVIDTRVQTLDDETILQLQEALDVFGSGGVEFLDALEQRALEGDATLAAENAKIVESERQRLDQQVQAQQTQFAGAAGSNFNTLALAATVDAQGQANADLAGIEGQLNLAARQQVSNELAQVIQGTEAIGNTIAGISGALKGAITDTTGTVTTDASKQFQSQEITDLLNELFSKTKYNETQSSKEGGFQLSF